MDESQGPGQGTSASQGLQFASTLCQ